MSKKSKRKKKAKKLAHLRRRWGLTPGVYEFFKDHNAKMAQINDDIKDWHDHFVSCQAVLRG